jgi:hypothetical protein
MLRLFPSFSLWLTNVICFHQTRLASFASLIENHFSAALTESPGWMHASLSSLLQQAGSSAPYDEFWISIFSHQHGFIKAETYITIHIFMREWYHNTHIACSAYLKNNKTSCHFHQSEICSLLWWRKLSCFYLKGANGISHHLGWNISLQSVFSTWQGQEIFLTSIASKLAMWPTHPPVQQILGAISTWVNLWGMKLLTYLHQMQGA